ncbi:MAG TPA: hypothetical protein VMZ53_18600 [Kofleriaceae bacterium]|nr:hypothetical protein [Kofleriaceae bacterium]
MTVFLLSPARCSGERAEMLARSKRSELGAKLREGQAPLGDVFAWLSALYFRGKLAYATRFGEALVMAPGEGLVSPAALISTKTLRAMGRVEIESPRFTKALTQDALTLAERHSGNVVLLGSIATGKYVDALLRVFGDRLLFPATFVGRGDMSRGGLMLRAAKSGEELEYCPVAGANRHGTRPSKLPKLPRERSIVAS